MCIPISIYKHVSLQQIITSRSTQKKSNTKTVKVNFQTHKIVRRYTSPHLRVTLGSDSMIVAV